MNELAEVPKNVDNRGEDLMSAGSVRDGVL